MPDDKFDELLRREAKGYRAGGQTPADAMWSRIEKDVARAIRPGQGIARRWPWLAAGVGIAAALIIGVAIGRRSMQRDMVTPIAESREPRADSSRNQQMVAVTWSHFVQAEMFLTEVRADLSTGRRDPQRRDRSRHLLARTRLLMANDAGQAPTVERLLQDLELVLAEIAALPDSGKRSMDARLLDERLRVGTILPRIRTILPSPSTPGGP